MLHAGRLGWCEGHKYLQIKREREFVKKGVSDIERRVEANYALINARAIFLLVDWLTDLS